MVCVWLRPVYNTVFTFLVLWITEKKGNLSPKHKHLPADLCGTMRELVAALNKSIFLSGSGWVDRPLQWRRDLEGTTCPEMSPTLLHILGGDDIQPVWSMIETVWRGYYATAGYLCCLFYLKLKLSCRQTQGSPPAIIPDRTIWANLDSPIPGHDHQAVIPGKPITPGGEN